MSVLTEPLFYMVLGISGMFLCGWLFDKAGTRYLPETDDEPEPIAPSIPRLLLNMVGATVGGIAAWLALSRTSLLVADLILLTALVSFAIASYRIRLRPLIAGGMPMPRLMSLVAALGLWAIPLLWFMHLHLAKSYGAA